MFGLFGKEKACEVCGSAPARNYLNIQTIDMPLDGKRLCKPHMVSTFKNLFLENPHIMVVTYPIFLTKIKADGMYAYYYTSELEDFDFDKKETEALRRILRAVPAGKECAYFDEATTKASIVTPSLFDFQRGDEDEKYYFLRPTLTPTLLATFEPQYLSKAEAWSKIEHAFLSWEGDFHDNIYAPDPHHGGEGAFL